ncbi:MAG: signal peptidase I [Patescibacteria group bacterium]
MRLTISDYDIDNKKAKQEVRQEQKPTKPASPSFAESPRSFILELVKIVLIALVIIIPIRYFLFQPFYVRGASMEPNFHDNEYLIIDEITYRFTEPQRGDVVVMRNPNRTSEFFIKRIIGLPGETVESTNGEVKIINDQFPDGIILSESYLAEGTITNNLAATSVPSDQYFVMGDNRSVSLDSRIFGSLPSQDIVGRAWLRVYPFSEFQHFVSPIYNLSIQ